MAGCIANCDTLVFPSGVPPLPELEESGYVTKYGTWRFLCKASPFPEFQANGWLCCRLCHLVFPCTVGTFPEFQANGCVAGCVTWLFASRVGLFSEFQANGCVAGCVTQL